MLTMMASGAGAVPVSVSASVSGDPANIATFTMPVNPATGEIIDGGGNPIPLGDMPFLTYGDFTVSGGNDLGATETIIGDGINDETWWVFDFAGDASFASFSASTDPLISAVLTLTLLPRIAPPFGDGTFVAGLNGAYQLEVTGFVGVPVALIIELIQPDLVLLGQANDTADILVRFFDDGTTGPGNALAFGNGQLPFKYFDDAQVLSATLELTRGVSVPEPGTLSLLAVGLVGLIGAACTGRETGRLRRSTDRSARRQP